MNADAKGNEKEVDAHDAEKNDEEKAKRQLEKNNGNATQHVGGPAWFLVRHCVGRHFNYNNL